MLSDVVINISNGFENSIDLEKQLWLINNYDAVIKYGINNRSQKVNFNNNEISLSIIPTAILYNIPCLIGFKEELDLKKLNNDISELLKNNIDVDKLLYIDSLALIENNKICNLKISRIQKFINCSFNIISLFDFTKKFKYICYITLDGYYNSDGDEYDNTQISSRNIFSITKPRSINNMIAFKDIIESFICFDKENDNELYKVVEKNKTHHMVTENSINTILLNYYWIDLDKLISVINYLEINILYLTGTYLLKNAKSLAIIKDKKKKFFEDIPAVYNFIKLSLEDNTNIAEIYLI